MQLSRFLVDIVFADFLISDIDCWAHAVLKAGEVINRLIYRVLGLIGNIQIAHHAAVDKHRQKAIMQDSHQRGDQIDDECYEEVAEGIVEGQRVNWDEDDEAQSFYYFERDGEAVDFR